MNGVHGDIKMKIKRTEMVALIFRSIEPYIEKTTYKDKVIMEIADTVLANLEKSGMFYCPVEDFGNNLVLRTPVGFDSELTPEEQEKINKYIEQELVLLNKLSEEGD
jgi:hypothetical protein